MPEKNNPGQRSKDSIMITAQQIEKFQLIYKEVVGEEISKEEALHQGTKLIRLMEIIYQPIKKEQQTLRQLEIEDDSKLLNKKLIT